jgi:hypothetical protein
MRFWTVVLALPLLSNTAPAAAQTPSFTRVRSPEPVITMLINEASLHSPTFAALLTEMESTDGLVYVEVGRCGHGVRACLIAMNATRDIRILRIRVSLGQQREHLMATIAHELRHALEVLSDPRINTTQAMQHFYLRNGTRQVGGSWETEAAIETGRAVGAELAGPPKTAADAESSAAHRTVTVAWGYRRG